MRSGNNNLANPDKIKKDPVTPKQPEIKTQLPGPEARKILDLEKKFLSPSYPRDYPLVTRRGVGSMIEDVDGNWFLDFNAGIGVAATGYSHPKVVEAVRRQTDEILHIATADFASPPAARLGEKLCAITPGDFPKRVYFGNSGTEVVEAALKLARWHTGRKNFIAFQGCFHGRTFGALSLTSSKPVQRQGFGPFLPGVYHAPYPHPYRCPMERKAEECRQECRCLSRIEDELFKAVLSPSEVAAIVLEPVQGEGGYLFPPDNYLPDLRALADRHGILIIADEIQTGMGRTGKMWACDHSGFVPDILLTSKGLASGLPLGAMVARAEVMNWGPGTHASTFGGNPVACAAALATIELVETGYMSRAASMGEYLMKALSGWTEKHPIVGEVRGRGLMIGIEIITDKQSRKPNSEAVNKIIYRAFERGLLLLSCGESTIRLIPPLIIEKEQIDFAVQILDDLLKEAAKSA